MATRTNVKTKPAAPAPAKKAAVKGKPPAKKADAAKAAKTVKKAPEKLFDLHSFVKFTGYASEQGADAVFEKDDILFIGDVETTTEGTTLYTCVKAEDAGRYLDDPEDADLVGGQIGSSEAVPFKGSELEALKTKFMPIRSVGRMDEILAEGDNDLVTIAVSLNDDAQENYFYLGGVIAKILQEGSYLKENGGDYEGDEAFSEFCQDTFGFAHAKARDLARGYTTLAALPNFDVSMLKAVGGWSKMRAIERYVTEENLEEVIKTASEHTQRELPAIMHETYVGADNKTPSGATGARSGGIKKISFSFKLVEAAAEGVKMTLAEVMKEKGFKDESEALEHICMTYAADHIGEQKASRIAKAINKGKPKPKPVPAGAGAAAAA